MRTYKTICCEKCGHTAKYAWDYEHHETGRRLPTHQYQARRMMSGNGAGDGATLQEFVTPTRPGAVEPDVLTPLLQALVTGSLSGVVVSGLAFVFNLPWYSPLLTIAIGTGGTWFYLLRQTQSNLISIERVEFSPQTITAVPAPVISETLHTVRLQVHEDNQAIKYAHLPLPYTDLQVIAKATINGRPFSLASWSGNGKLLSRSQFETLRDWLLKAGYASWVDDSNHNQGILFNSKGKAFWRGLTAV